MPDIKHCVHMNMPNHGPYTSVEQKSMVDNVELHTITMLCPVCSAVLITLLQRVESSEVDMEYVERLRAIANSRPSD